MRGNYKHGGRGTRIYAIWKSMRERCNNPNTNRSKIYHDNGIRVCHEWDDFIKFRQWSLDNGYADNLTIDRIDSKGNYEPSNCRWVTQKVQQNNRSNNRHIEWNGESHTLGEWSDITGIKLGTIHERLKRGWNISKALTVKPTIGKNQYA